MTKIWADMNLALVKQIIITYAIKINILSVYFRLSFKSFDLSALKYSKNFEGSFLINKLNLGLVAGADVILSSESPIPRYAKANLTVELFGNSINLFEAGGRVEGLEALIEKVLGSTGYFPSNNKVINSKWNVL